MNVGGGFAGRDNGCVLDCTLVMLAFVNIPSTTKFYDIWTVLLYLKKNYLKLRAFYKKYNFSRNLLSNKGDSRWQAVYLKISNNLCYLS